MRVLVGSDVIGALSSLAAGRVLAAGWAAESTAVLPVGEAGAGFVQAAADRFGTELVSEVVEDRLVVSAGADGVTVLGLPGPGTGTGPIPYEATSRPLGLALAAALRDPRDRPRTLLVDLVGDDVHDGGAGLLEGLGGIESARAALAGVELVGVVPAAQRGRLLLGLRGITSVRGREAGDDPARLLATDAALERLAADLGVADTAGAGACGGVGLAVLALGGRLVTGPELGFGGITGPADLVVTGCARYDFASRGGGVVAAAAELAQRLLCPCVVLAEEVLIGGREMRTMGVEAAYETGAVPAEFSADRLRELAVRVGRSWRW